MEIRRRSNPNARCSALRNDVFPALFMPTSNARSASWTSTFRSDRNRAIRTTSTRMPVFEEEVVTGPVMGF